MLQPVPGSDKSAFYISNFISEDEESYLLRKINETPQQKWKILPNRRLQLWGGTISQKQILISEPLPSFVTEYPNILGRIKTTGAFANSPHSQPNHVILNEYHPGQGIMPHEDGSAYYPVVATLSLGSHAVFHYYQYCEADNGLGRAISQDPVLTLLLEPRSLVITTGTLYQNHLHGIAGIHEDHLVPGQPPKFIDHSRNGTGVIANWDMLTNDDICRGGILKRKTRYSLTCRDVERVANVIKR